MEVTFAFDLNQDVVINATEGTGKVIGLWIDRDGVKTAYVQYFAEDGARCTGHFREDEIKSATAGK